jgi:hypothetical protein
LAHFASVSATAEYSAQIIDVLVESALELKSYVLRGTLLSALSLIAINPKMVASLQAKGFGIFRFGEHSCVVPMKPSSILIQPQKVEIVPPPKLPAPSKWGILATQLLNPIHRGTARRALEEAVKAKAAGLNTTENCCYVHSLVASHSFLPE